MSFLRKHGIYEFFHPTDGVRQAWKILSEPLVRLNVEQALLARLDRKAICLRLNKKHGWHLSADGMSAFHDMFWNVELLTWDEWGRFLYGRSGMYERYMSMLQATPELAMFHLQLQQAIDSKTMIQRTQEIAYFTIEEVSRKPGTGPDKVKAIGVLGKTIVDCHEALSTSDMALKDILKNFERFRMEHPQIPPRISRCLLQVVTSLAVGLKRSSRTSDLCHSRAKLSRDSCLQPTHEWPNDGQTRLPT